MSSKVYKALKSVIFQMFFHFRSFFSITYPYLVALCFGAIALAILLLTTSTTPLGGMWMLVIATACCAWLYLIQRQYSAILAWSDPRQSRSNVYPLSR
ncbi:hypothetical protein [Photobacterium sanctipauli]|uniref:hypothetical protein n=1 Tax=Photobacterium sanctipauli TaxID=1342794 RepID=UPI0011B21C3F|nr:hypothetical protein [Photobacterium sanctipauli]